MLEPWLADLRARKANQLIPPHLRRGRILDIGCGTYPYFLSHTSFKEKFGIDQHARPESIADINWYSLNLNIDPRLPFEDHYFSAVTMLAVAEHLNPVSLVQIFSEVNRVLHQGGILIITTPAAWTDGLLNWMARIKMVSKEEIDEHIYVYTLPLLGWYFGKAGFEMTQLRFGYFELNMNLWATAEK